MIFQELEIFTAKTAAKAGLIEAVERGETRIDGRYELTPNGIELQQKNFVFNDKDGNLRIGTFDTDAELLAFSKYLGDAQ